ncbi:hypothetical protein OAH87_06590 [Marinomonas sp.]|nr:hypothetical protein [Marinomonas sp.]MDB4838113.1 hypothetical protein [Marinomonas sp.]
MEVVSNKDSEIEVKSSKEDLEHNEEEKSDSSDRENNNENSAPLSFSKLKNIHREAKEKIKAGVIEELEDIGINDADDDLVNSIVEDITGDVRRKEFRNGFISKLRLATMFAMAAVLTMATLLLFQINGKFVDKVSIKNNITLAISNKASLSELKTIFEYKANPTQELLGPLLSNDNYYRKEDLTLQKVLEELKVDILTSNSLDASAITMKNSLNIVLQEYLTVNPFEGLDDNDKKDLSNITAKLSDESYKLITPEIEGVTESLKVKNSLIREYLNSSNMSLYISLAAFIFSILVVLWQYLPNARASQKQLIADAIKEHTKDLNSNKPIKRD